MFQATSQISDWMEFSWSLRGQGGKFTRIARTHHCFSQVSSRTQTRPETACQFSLWLMQQLTETTFIQCGYMKHQELPRASKLQGIAACCGLLCEPVPLETDGFFGETKFHLRFHLRFNLFSRGFCELPVNILKLIDMAWADSSLQELHEITAAEAPNSPKTKMINGVLLQTPGTLLTACFRETRQVCLNCAGLWLLVVRGFGTVQIPLAGRHWHFRA